MSDSFGAALSGVDYGKYIDEIQAELEKAIAEAGPKRTTVELEFIQGRLLAVMRKQSTELARELGFGGNHVMVFMTAASILATAWVSFALKRETLDLSKSPEERLGSIEVLGALELALRQVIESAGDYAERYQEAAGEGSDERKK